MENYHIKKSICQCQEASQTPSLCLIITVFVSPYKVLRTIRADMFGKIKAEECLQHNKHIQHFTVMENKWKPKGAYQYFNFSVFMWLIRWWDKQDERYQSYGEGVATVRESTPPKNRLEIFVMIEPIEFCPLTECLQVILETRRS